MLHKSFGGANFIGQRELKSPFLASTIFGVFNLNGFGST